VGSLIISDNSIDTLGDTLYIQQLAMGGLDILAGKVTVDTDGNVFIAEHLTVGGGIATSEIKPIDGGDLTINLKYTDETGEESTQDTTGLGQDKTGNSGFGKLLVKGIRGEIVASIDASGSAVFKEIATDLLRINTNNEATQSAVLIASAENFEKTGVWAPGIETNATAGEATLPAYETELIIYNDKLTDQSLIYLTPTSDTKNKILYVKAKHADATGEESTPDTTNEESTQDTTGLGQDETGNRSYFVVGMNGELAVPVEFNWWIIN